MRKFTNQPNRSGRAFTIIELVAVMGVIALSVSMLLPAMSRTRGAAKRILCSNNLKQVGTAAQVWALSHRDAFPMRVAVANGGYADYVGMRTLTLRQSTSRGVFGYFLALSNELRTPRPLICPSENEPRVRATTFSEVISDGSTNLVPFTNDLNTSYFVGVDAVSSSPRMFLAGDHNLGSDGNVVPVTAFSTAPSFYRPDFKVSLGTNFATNGGVGWLKTMHSGQGNVLLADGTVQQYDRAGLQRALLNSAGRGLGVGGPNFSLPVGCSGPGVNRIQFP